MNDKRELIRTVVRALAFLIPLTAICIGMFVLKEVQDTLIGAVMGASATAGVFYFKKEEE